MANTYVVIMAGGSGTRFWPFSRVTKPKQFLDVLDTGHSLLQMTYERFLEIAPKENIYVVSNKRYGSLIKEQLPDLQDDQILLEPFQRNTAPCIAYASYKIASRDPEARIVVSPSDHVVFREKAFTALIEKALAATDASKLFTIGVKPSRPETGYGYIQYVEEGDSEIKKVKTFTEKPAKELARKFVESGEFVWNAGIFVWSARAIKKAIGKYLHEMDEVFSGLVKEFFTPREQEAVDMAYAQCKNISIDYGVMEKADEVYVLLGDFGWSDLGSWQSLYEISKKDENNNVVKANAILYNSKNCTVSGPMDKLIVLSGLDGYLVSAHGNAILICNKNDGTELKTIVHDIQVSKSEEFL